MLPLPIFDYHRPRTLHEALDLLASLGPSARIIAGGTDVLPNMKQGLFDPEHVVSIARLEELRGIEIAPRGEALLVGAGMKLAEIAESLLAQRLAPALAEAAGLVGGPHHRAMGTLGGNICLDTRCRYYNQTYFWRKSLGFCLKKDGTVCHVVKGGARCVAAASNDSAPTLVALEAEIHLLGKGGERRVPARDFYTADGINNTVIQPGEIVVRAAIPVALGRRSAFEKLRKRGAIDFPLLSVAARVDTEPGASQGPARVVAADVVVSALGARPRRVRAAAKVGPGASVSQLPEMLAQAAFAECKPLTNLDDEAEWRREMVPILVAKAVRRALGEAGEGVRPPSAGALALAGSLRLSCRTLAPGRRSRQGDPGPSVRTEGYTFLAALALHVGVVLIARAMPPLSLLQASDRRDLRIIEIELPTALPVEVREPPPLPEGASLPRPSEQTERAPDARLASRTVAPERSVGPQATSTAEPAPENPHPGPPAGPDFDKLPDEGKEGVLGVPGTGIGNPVWAIRGVLPQEAPAGAPASTVAPAARPVDSDIAGKVVRNEMAKRDKELGLDAPLAGSMASAVQAAVMGSDIPAGTRGSITCNVSPSGVVSGCKLTTSTGGGSVAWNNALQAASAITGPLSGQYARGAIVTIEVNVRDTPPAGGKGGFTGTGMSFDVSNIGAHATRQVRVSHQIAAR